MALLTSRTAKVALGKTTNNQNVFNENIQFLKSVIDLFRNIQVGKDKQFKSIQTDIMLTTQVFIELTKYLINGRRYVFVLEARFTQDCVENLFSNIRKKFPISNTLRCENSLKILCVS